MDFEYRCATCWRRHVCKRTKRRCYFHEGELGIIRLTDLLSEGLSLIYGTNVCLIVMLQWICHDWSDEHCLKFLKNCYAALPDNGKVILGECILPVAPDTSLATKGVVHIDVIMLAHNPGGKERTEQEFEALAKGSGFQGFRVACSAFNTYVIEFLKKI